MNRVLFTFMFTALTQMLSLTLLAEDRALGLAVGATIPDVTVQTEKDEDSDLRTAVAKRPAVLNPDYKSRLDPVKILEAARGVEQ